MQLFQNKRHTLTPIERESFKLEKDIQSLVESNMETLFELEFISSEFAVGEFRLDSLAFDEQNKSFVIVEYKKGHNSSVVDQGYSYLSVMLNNKAEFILEYNEKKGMDKRLRKADIDWTSSRVIFVSPSFNTYQKNSVNFRDVPFELWEIKKFEGGLITIGQCESSSNESIKKLSKKDSGSMIAKVSSEVKVFSEEDHVNSLDNSIRPVWWALKAKLEQYSDTSLLPNKNYISWKRDNATICFIKFRKKALRIRVRRGRRKKAGKTSKGFFTVDDPKGLTKERLSEEKSGTTIHFYLISLEKPEEMDYVMFLLEQKYNSMDGGFK